MLAIVTALRAEADPIIERFSLRRETTSAAFEIFQSSELLLAVSGIGRVKSAMTVGALCHGAAGKGIQSILNVGVVGCTNKSDLGAIFLIHKVHGPSGSRTFLPDMLLPLACEERPLTTVDTPQYDRGPFSAHEPMLIDMEASGFCEAASHFLSPARIQLLKIASDNLQPTSFTRTDLANLIGRHIEVIEQALFGLLHLPNGTETALGSADQLLLSRIAKQCGFSFQQRRLLWELATRFKTQSPAQSLESLLSSAPASVHSKRQAREVFNMLRESFAQSNL